MAVNDLIKTTDYNNLRANIIDIIGNGSATYGYGQTLQSSAKVNHEKISQTDWDLLRFDIVNARTHQDGVAQRLLILMKVRLFLSPITHSTTV
jgi:hypothetical protein